MRKFFLFVGLLVILILMVVPGRIRSGAPTPSVSPPVPQTETQAELRTTGQPADQLIAAATSADVATASNAYRDLERIGYCPYLADSPESPVGMLTAVYGDPASDTARVRDAIVLLVKQGCDINQYSAAGLTPLHNAVLFRQPELLRFLLEQGADPKLRVIPIPGKPQGHRIAHHDAYGIALVLRKQFPDDAGLKEILELLQPGA